VDFIVYIGATRIICRVQGVHWHTLPGRVAADDLQALRLRAKGFRLWDAWEDKLYQAWADGRLRTFVDDGILNAV
jgi:hypothetical protein